MPTFFDPGADAREASEALRGLAHATQAMQRPQDMCSVLGDLLSGVQSLRQVLDQSASTHASNRPLAFDDYGDHASGSADGLAAADDLHQATTLIDQAEDWLNAGMSAAGRIACHSQPAREQVPVRRWISVVFLQDSEADEVLDMIDRDGPEVAMDHLKNWDYGGNHVGSFGGRTRLRSPARWHARPGSPRRRLPDDLQSLLRPRRPLPPPHHRTWRRPRRRALPPTSDYSCKTAAGSAVRAVV